ncbi:Uncharacterised protein [Mycobacteroides abscessus subsp. abscessus]|nr:Uncharacterised protein [Mycobacteroides abscessus subsp. abscessus]
MVTVPLGLLEVLEHHNPDALTPAITVGRGVERLTAAIGSQESALTHGNERLRLEHHVHPAGKRHVALSVRDRPHRQMGGNE